MGDVIELRRDAMRALIPPPKIDLPTWAEATIRLPSKSAAHPGPLRLWPQQVGIARSIGAEDVPRVTVLKSARVGYSQMLTAAIASYVANDPAPILMVLPTEGDCSNYVKAYLDPTLAASPDLSGIFSEGTSTQLQRHFAGGSLSLVGAAAARNLRAATARVLLLDEVDNFEIDTQGEGDPVALAITRTRTYSPPKIVMGSTPLDRSTSRILAAWEESDQRVFECPCPACGARHEIRWADIHWRKDAGDDGETLKHHPETAHWACPDCGGIVEDGAEKAAFVLAGEWRATRPEVSHLHHGYRMSALASLLDGASWPSIVAEHLAAKTSSERKSFVTTVLGEPWDDEDGQGLDDSSLVSQVETFSLDSIPAEVILLTAGCDLQDDRIEITFVGWSRDKVPFVLGHHQVWGSPQKGEPWKEVDDLLKRTYAHPRGGTLRLDAAFIDSGSGPHTDAVYDFARSRNRSRIFASKGDDGWKKGDAVLSQSKRARLYIVGTDGIKSRLFNMLAADPIEVRFSDTLTPDWFRQLTSERLVTRHSRGRLHRQWHLTSGTRNEALDCMVYAIAARALLNGINLDQREAELSTAAAPVRRPTMIKSDWFTPPRS